MNVHCLCHMMTNPPPVGQEPNLLYDLKHVNMLNIAYTEMRLATNTAEMFLCFGTATANKSLLAHLHNMRN